MILRMNAKRVPNISPVPDQCTVAEASLESLVKGYTVHHRRHGRERGG